MQSSVGTSAASAAWVNADEMFNTETLPMTFGVDALSAHAFSKAGRKVEKEL